MKTTYKSTVQSLIEEYLEKGFGSMNKSDFEVAIFYLWQQQKSDEDLSTYDISRKLKISETKVKTLLYEVDLKYKDDSCYKRLLLKALEGAHCTKDNDIKVLITNKGLRAYISDVVRKNKKIWDSSFNTEIIIIKKDDFLDVIESIYGRNSIEQILRNIPEEKVSKNIVDKKEKIWDAVSKGVIRLLPVIISVIETII